MSLKTIKLCILLSWFFVLLVPRPGAGSDAYKDPATGMEFVFIEGGCFQMGSESGAVDERPVHTACVGDFFMAKYEVTQKQWRLIMGNNPSFFDSCGDDCPVENVSWADAEGFIGRLNRKAGANGYRLPTEAEWEYAARAGSKAKYSFGDDDRNLGDFAWYDRNSSHSEGPEVLYMNRFIKREPSSRRSKETKCLGTLRHARQRLGVGP